VSITHDDATKRIAAMKLKTDHQWSIDHYAREAEDHNDHIWLLRAIETIETYLPLDQEWRKTTIRERLPLHTRRKARMIVTRKLRELVGLKRALLAFHAAPHRLRVPRSSIQ
jgi:hypothetical protein